MAPYVAVRLSRLRTTALAGTTTLPVMRNSTVKVTSAISPPAIGRRPNSECFESTSCADDPPTLTGNGAGVWRTALTSRSPAGDTGSTAGTTDRNVPAPVVDV